MSEETFDVLKSLQFPFHPSEVIWKPGSIAKDQSKALALAYAGLRAYQDRLDQLLGLSWSVTYTTWNDKIICHLSINGTTRSSTGEPDSQSERSEISGTAAEAQAFKRACSMFGLGRYLYHFPSLWVPYDFQGRSFTAQAKAQLEGVVIQHYRRATEKHEPDAKTLALRQQVAELGELLYCEQWPQVQLRNVERLTNGGTTALEDLDLDHLQKLVKGLELLKERREAETGPINP